MMSACPQCWGVSAMMCSSTRRAVHRCCDGNQGALGSIGSLFRTSAAVKRDIDVVQQLTNRNYAVNHIPPTLDADAFRHTLGTLMYENGARLEDIQQQLGHRSITSTTIYASPSQAQVDSKVAKIFKNMR